MKDLMDITIRGSQIIEKTVKPSGNSGRVYLPKDWIGKRVKVVLLESSLEKNNIQDS